MPRRSEVDGDSRSRGPNADQTRTGPPLADHPMSEIPC